LPAALELSSWHWRHAGGGKVRRRRRRKDEEWRKYPSMRKGNNVIR